ncbi:MAG TPA: PDZ domain-containing protein [Candidatus Acidoferrum sp.]|nr:PDZ domain-containing protein [Candidatus Acidoferrum sp.]
MNTKHLLTAVGLSALTVALVALPGSSARKAEPSGPAGPKFVQVEFPQEAARRVEEMKEALDNLQVVEAGLADGDEDMQVIVTSGNGWLGARVTEVNSDKVKELKLPAERGVVLGKIVPESPAAKAGLKESDVVTEVNGQRVEGTEQFRRMIREIPAGRVAQFIVWRDGRSQTIGVTLGKSEMRHGATLVAPAAPGNFAFQMPEIPEMGEFFENGPWVTSSRTRLGIDAENVDGEFGNYFGAPEGEGILVRGVFPDSPAARAGLKVGDVITSVDGERIRSVGELREKIVEKKQEKTVKLGVIRNKAATTISVELPAPAENREFHTGVRTNI